MGLGILIQIQIHPMNFQEGYSDAADVRVLVSKQSKRLCARAINIFMEIKALSTNDKTLIRYFRPMTLRGAIKGLL